jgi:hypothetical protein
MHVPPYNNEMHSQQRLTDPYTCIEFLILRHCRWMNIYKILYAKM